MKPRLFEHYNKKVVPELMKGFEYKNPMECPKLKKNRSQHVPKRGY